MESQTLSAEVTADRIQQMLESKKAPLVRMKDKWMPDEIENLLANFKPKDPLTAQVIELSSVVLQYRKVLGLSSDDLGNLMLNLLDRMTASAVITASIGVTVIRKDGTIEEYGWENDHLVVTAGKDKIATCMGGASAATIADFKFEAIGTSSTAAAVGQTGLIAELSTEYNNSGNVRATGTQSNPSTAVYRLVATNVVDATVTIVECGVLSSATPGAGTLFDRSVISSKTLDSGDGIQITTDVTIS